jgi:NAD(P)-dependent dehydrogenase (short-subunit alcohol dehydrogenase family)
MTQRKRVLLVGSTGTIGKAVAAALSPDHDVVGIARRGGDIAMDATSVTSIAAMYAQAGAFDALVSTMGSAVPGSLTELSADDVSRSFRLKVLSQINLVRLGLATVRAGGSFTLSGGVLSTEPRAGYTAISMTNAAIDAFCAAAALELPGGVRINSVAPVFVLESLLGGGVSDTSGYDTQTAAETALGYVAAVERDFTGRVVDPRELTAT